MPASLERSEIIVAALVAAVALLVAAPGAAAGQGAGHHPRDTVGRGVRFSVRAQAVALATRVDPGVGGEDYTEGYLAHPIVMAMVDAGAGRVGAVVTVNLEGLTLERGQLTLGAYGEGYADRRHPHTYLHEAILGVRGSAFGVDASLFGGKGFVAFGTDDPMVRPFASYPVNHHLAQILERYVAVAAVRRGPLLLEGSLFNGDEPTSVGAPPRASRFGDSWAARATVIPLRTTELAGSYAFVTSPELAGGNGLDQRKWSLSARHERAGGVLRYALIEWARTDAMFGDVRTQRLTSLLAEGSIGVGRGTLSARFEDTRRPEEERLLDPFRTTRAPVDLGVIGITRWRIGTVAAGVPLALRLVDLAPFVELSYARPTEELRPSGFVPEDFYGSRSLWSMSVGVRFGVGAPRYHRMGRYGVAALGNAPHGEGQRAAGH